jgi:hypothetical protein
MSKYITIGEIGVDAGLCWIGDPCYCVTPDCNEHPAQTWGDFCEILTKQGHDRRGYTQFNYKRGHEGLGVAVSTGYGDGTYPVQIRKNSEGRVVEVRVLFVDE